MIHDFNRRNQNFLDVAHFGVNVNASSLTDLMLCFLFTIHLIQLNVLTH